MTVPAPMVPPPSGGRRSAVLILFGDGPPGPDVLLVQRSPWLRRHAGQPAFPGGAIDDADGGPVRAALREAAEEALVDPASVEVLTVLPELFITRSGFSVTPVLAWWREPGPVSPGDLAEVTAVRRVPVADLASPRNRLMIRYPTGQTGPAFRTADMLIWGFTGFVVDRLLALGGWEEPWDTGNVEGLPPEALAAAIGRPAPPA
jgi:8-oxo-dGTP pyrophosphatase MutT (NUDIX family)